MARIVFTLSVVLSCLFSRCVYSQQNERVYHYLNEDNIPVFTDARPKKRGYEVVELDCLACDPHNIEYWQNTPLQDTLFHAEISQSAQKHNIDIAFLKALIHAESEFNEKATSKVGAKGLMQLMPALLAQYQVTDPYNSTQNIRAGSAYLASLLARFNHNTKLAAAAYNAGPGAVKAFKGVPPYAQTQAFVKRIDVLRLRYRKLHKQGSQLATNNDTLSAEQSTQ